MVLESLQSVKEWLKKNKPEYADIFGEAASPEAITEVEKTLGITLPESYKQFLALHNGMKAGSPFVEWCTLFKVEEIPAMHAHVMDLLDDEDDDDFEGDADDEVRPVFLSKKWFPIGRSPRARDYLCLDFDPSDEGKLGQIVLFVSDDEDRECIAPGFAELMDTFLEELESGDVEFPES